MSPPINKKDLKREAMELLYKKHWLIFCKLSSKCQWYEERRYGDYSCEIEEVKKEMIDEKRKILWIESILGYKSLKESKA